jgi:hypothetical protein
MSWLNTVTMGLVNSAVEEGKIIAAGKQLEIDQKNNEIALLRIKANAGSSYVPTGPSQTAFDEIKSKLKISEAARAEAEQMAKDWMTSTESFKRLAKKYSKDCKVSPEQFDSDLNEIKKDVSEETARQEEAQRIEDLENLTPYQREQFEIAVKQAAKW